ncbi:hypothetical protein M9458_053593, partial [Cirrhinus mrigala]
GFPEDAQSHGSHFLCNSPGAAQYTPPPILAESQSSIPRLALGLALCQGNPLHQCPVGTDLQTEGSHDRSLQLGLGSFVRGQTSIRLLIKIGAAFAHQLPQNNVVFSVPKNPPASLKGASPPGHNPFTGWLDIVDGFAERFTVAQTLQLQRPRRRCDTSKRSSTVAGSSHQKTPSSETIPGDICQLRSGSAYSTPLLDAFPMRPQAMQQERPFNRERSGYLRNLSSLR